MDKILHQLIQASLIFTKSKYCTLEGGKPPNVQKWHFLHQQIDIPGSMGGWIAGSAGKFTSQSMKLDPGYTPEVE